MVNILSVATESWCSPASWPPVWKWSSDQTNVSSAPSLPLVSGLSSGLNFSNTPTLQAFQYISDTWEGGASGRTDEELIINISISNISTDPDWLLNLEGEIRAWR